MRKKWLHSFVALGLLVFFTGCSLTESPHAVSLLPKESTQEQKSSSVQATELNQNRPQFSPEELSLAQGTWQHFSPLDHLNRVGEANALLHREMMPTEERERLFIEPTGWQQKKLKNKEWLYHRCHLIGFQLTGENNNPKNLVTGTETLNIEGMLPYENQVAAYLRETGNHVRYRVTPDFHGEETLARGIQLEAQSIEDEGLSFHVYLPNVEPGVVLDYQTGRARME